jgi:hypothetical protein
MANEQPLFNFNSWVFLSLLVIVGFIIFLKKSEGIKGLKVGDKKFEFIEDTIKNNSVIVKTEKPIHSEQQPKIEKPVELVSQPDNSNVIVQAKSAINAQNELYAIARKYTGKWRLLTHFENCKNTSKKYSDMKLVTYSEVELSVKDNQVEGLGLKCSEQSEGNATIKFSKRENITLSIEVINRDSEVSGFLETVDNQGFVKASIRISGIANYIGNKISLHGEDKNCKYEIELRKDLMTPCDN